MYSCLHASALTTYAVVSFVPVVVISARFNVIGCQVVRKSGVSKKWRENATHFWILEADSEQTCDPHTLMPTLCYSFRLNAFNEKKNKVVSHIRERVIGEIDGGVTKGSSLGRMFPSLPVAFLTLIQFQNSFRFRALPCSVICIQLGVSTSSFYSFTAI